MATYRLEIEYDGTAFLGWQVQPQGLTVQGVLEQALATVLRTPTAVVGSGRTDAGVHARGQVAHFKAEEPVDLYRLKRSLNGLLPDAVAVRSLAPADDAFHARYDARLRRYHYRIATTPRPLERHTRWHVRPAPDVARMNTAAEALLGTHHFGAFCKARSETTNRICTLFQAQWLPESRAGDYTFVIEGDRFLHGMVRAVVGTLLEVGRGKRPLDDLPRVLSTRDRRAAGTAAPAHGLVLDFVGYTPMPARPADPAAVVARADADRSRR